MRLPWQHPEPPLHTFDRWLLAMVESLGAPTASDFSGSPQVQAAGRQLGDEHRLTRADVDAWLQSAFARALITVEDVGYAGQPLSPPRLVLTDAGRERLHEVRVRAGLLPPVVLSALRTAMSMGLKALLAALPIAAVARWIHLVTGISRTLAGVILLLYLVGGLIALIIIRYGQSKLAWKRAINAFRAESPEWRQAAKAKRLAGPVKKLEPLSDEQGRAALQRINHIVVLMMENRSFDHMLGYLRLEGRIDVDGLTGAEINSYDGRDYHPQHLGNTALKKTQDPCHTGECVADQLGEGKMDGFVRNFAENHQTADPGVVMGYYDEDEVPVYDHLAEHYCICDRWFCSIPGSTWPNRLYSVCGRADGDLDNKKVPLYDLKSFVHYLPDNAWRWYSHDPGSLRFIDSSSYAAETEHFAYFDRNTVASPTSFLDDAAAGKLPSVSWIDPNFVDLRWFGPAGSNDDHPPSDVVAGQELVLKLYNAVVQGPKWEETLLVIAYDEHGGFYDHVPPPGADKVADDDPKFRCYGPRVPAIIVSPFVEPRTVAHDPFDHTSLISTILRRFATNPDASITAMGARVAAADHLGRLLVREKPLPQPAKEDYEHIINRVSTWRGDFLKERLLAQASETPTPPQPNELQQGVLDAAAVVREQVRPNQP